MTEINPCFLATQVDINAENQTKLNLT